MERLYPGQQNPLQNELLGLDKKILQLSAMVEERVRKATEAIATMDRTTIDYLFNSDHEVDQMEIDIEELCMKILALYRPLASDLRYIVAVIKINNEMERIADIAVNIAQRVDNISKFHHSQSRHPFDFAPMSRRVLKMLKTSFDALVNRDGDLAKTVFKDDDEVDIARNICYEKTKQHLMEDSLHPGYYINTYLLSRHLERIADRAVNIAEEVVYLAEGEITRFP